MGELYSSLVAIRKVEQLLVAILAVTPSWHHYFMIAYPYDVRINLV